MIHGLRHIIRKQFVARFFILFTVVFILASTIVAAFFVGHQTKTLTNGMIHNGTLLSEVLAYNSRLGVFSENPKLLEDLVNGLLKMEGVCQVSVYNHEGKPLIDKANPGKEMILPFDFNQASPDQTMNEQKTVYVEYEDHMVFCSPVKSSSAALAREAFFIDNHAAPDFTEVIGFSRIIMGKESLKRQIIDLIYRSIFMALLFWLAGTGTIFFIVKKITGPLKNLTRAVERMGESGKLEKISAETDDEIGNLAKTFNKMSEALELREMEKERLEARLRQAQKMEAIGTLAGGIAHDFNNIIGAIIGFSELTLLEVRESPSLKEKISEILNAGNRASALVNQILTFSRQTEQSLVPLQASSIVKEVLKLLRPTIPASIEIRSDIDPDCGLILSDPTTVHQILMNLCTNAAQAMKNQSTGILDVSLKDVFVDPKLAGEIGNITPGNYQKLSVGDTGYGISRETMERMFEPFFTTKEIGEGTGMGLSVVHGIVKNNKGGIVVESTPGMGARFDIYLPLIETLPRNIEQSVEEELPRGSENILVVDDEKPLVKSTRSLLETLGYTVIGQEGGPGALEIFQKDPLRFNLVITDMTMPQMSGAELSRRMLAIRPDIPVLLCTGYSERFEAEKALAHGIAGILMKPVNRKMLAEAVRSIIDEWERNAKA
jgi:signal transduction histidine kinase/CheY-like chemotaxis protein